MGKKRMLGLSLALLFVGGGLFLQSAPAWSQVCKPTTHENIQVKLQYLRRLSIDMRGQLPTTEESQEVIRTGQIPKDLLGRWLKSDLIFKQLRHYHRDLLWANISPLAFKNEWRLNKGDGDKEPYWSTYRSSPRGGEVGCANTPLEKNSDGSFKTKVFPKDSKNPETKREGWVKVKPYWSNKEVKVCAIDALGAAGKGGGCGDNLKFCQSDHAKTAQMFTSALIDQTLNFAEYLIRNNRSYADFIQAPLTIANGPISHLIHYQLNTVDDVKIDNIYKDFPKINFSDKKWKLVAVDKRHAGMLTMPLYLLKYTSNRSRANQFYNKMLCKPFQAPPGGLPAGNDPCHDEPNLMKRCGCKYCHQTLEPAAAYWGRWLQTGLVYLDAKKYPPYQQSCSGVRPDRNKCKLYVTKATHPDQEQYRGYLAAYMFATNTMKKNIEMGPIGIAKKAIQSDAFSLCTTKNIWKWFVGDPSPSPELLEQLASKFSGSQYNFRILLQEILKHPAYAQGRLYHISYSK